MVQRRIARPIAIGVERMDERGHVAADVARLLAARDRRGSTANDGGHELRSATGRVVPRASAGQCAGRLAVERRCTVAVERRWDVELVARRAIAGDRCRTVIAWRRLRCCAVVRHVIGVHASVRYIGLGRISVRLVDLRLIWVVVRLVRLVDLRLIWLRLVRVVRLVDLRLIWLRLVRLYLPLIWVGFVWFVDLRLIWVRLVRLGPTFEHLARFAATHVDIERIACADLGSRNRFARQGRHVEYIAARGSTRRRCIARGWLFDVDVHAAFDLHVTFDIDDAVDACNAFDNEPSPRAPLECCRRRDASPQRDIESVRCTA
jgi:hypothetical protein